MIEAIGISQRVLNLGEQVGLRMTGRDRHVRTKGVAVRADGPNVQIMDGQYAINGVHGLGHSVYG